MDDVLAAVDTHVAKHIIKHCLLDLLKHSTRIIVTENRLLTYHANQVLHIADGTVKPSDITPEDYDDDDGYIYDGGSSHDDLKVNDDADRKSLDSVMLEETKEFGTLSSDVLTSYWKSTGGVLGFVVLLSVLLMQMTRNLSDAWLAHWVSSNATENAADATEFYLKIYTFIAVSNSAITFFRAFLFAFAGIKAAKFIHNKLLTCVFYVRWEFTVSLDRFIEIFLFFRQNSISSTSLRSDDYSIDFLRTHTPLTIPCRLF